MGAFKQYLDSLDPFHNSHLLIVEGKWYTHTIDDLSSHSHHFTVGQHETKVSFEPKPNNHWNVSYSVNDAYNKKYTGQYGYKPSEQETQQIMHGVAGTVHHFIANHKPKALHLQANNPEKEKLYQTFAHHLAKHYGGTVKTGEMSPIFHASKVSVHF